MFGAYYQGLLAVAGARKPYTPVSYLESTGTQYINTGVLPDLANGDKIEIDYYNPGTSGSVCVFGCRATGIRNGVYATGNSVVYCDSDGYSPANFYITSDIVLTAEDLETTVNSQTISFTRHVTCALPMHLFCLNNFGTAALFYNGMRLYRWKYRHNGTLAQDLVPALDANGVPCMWDTVSNTALYNAGTGTFNYA